MHDGILVAAIAAIAENGVIGVDGDLPWHLPADLRWFKKVTRGHAIIMGRKTWQTLPKPLPRRLNIVLTRAAASLQADVARYGAGIPRSRGGLLVVTSITDALDAAVVWEREALAAARISTAEVMVVGGAGVYAALWPAVDRFYRTRIAVAPDGDTRFPDVDLGPFRLTESILGEGEPAHVFEVLSR